MCWPVPGVRALYSPGSLYASFPASRVGENTSSQMDPLSPRGQVGGLFPPDPLPDINCLVLALSPWETLPAQQISQSW